MGVVQDRILSRVAILRIVGEPSARRHAGKVRMHLKSQSVSRSVVSFSLQPRGLELTRLPLSTGILQETPVRPLGREDPLEEGMARHGSMLAWRIPMDRGSLVNYSPHNGKEQDTSALQADSLLYAFRNFKK